MRVWSFKSVTIKGGILTRWAGLLSEVQMCVTKLRGTLLNRWSRLTTLLNQPLVPELRGKHTALAHCQRAHPVLEFGECLDPGFVTGPWVPVSSVGLG